jgi:hypothetical protein
MNLRFFWEFSSRSFLVELFSPFLLTGFGKKDSRKAHLFFPQSFLAHDEERKTVQEKSFWYGYENFSQL